MKRVYIASNPADAELVASLLMSRRIDAIVKNAHLWPIAGLSMTVDGAPAVWVTNDADEPEARRVIAESKQPTKSDLAPWKCQACGEENDGPFGLCWNCGRQAPLLPEPID